MVMDVIIKMISMIDACKMNRFVSLVCVFEVKEVASCEPLINYRSYTYVESRVYK